MKLVLASVLILVGCEQRCYKSVMVLAVGGCDKYGRCGVLTEIGASSASHPVVGQMIKKQITCPKQEAKQ